ncbi:DEAD/DEAH box helicase [Pseudooceanicola sp. 216_PA32_1]|uniref:DEAD/DEAH box helicase n=1 Tax=Pseudooceanicola pacificus TaxID=2676438 RepID=A0A844W940_9RHOB|nr:DEAD/DEAH box helicase [Pseudooceanicola pacificus]MWB77343.1 DEAD/DEAH box helicase [Pseudooceanicola pacificus]
MIQTLSDALAERGYDTMTPVQLAVTDPALDAADLLVSAQTGSGKTVGFGLAIGPSILDEAGKLGHAASPLALVIAPTRELAFQVARELGWLYARTGARVATCVGGMDMRDERRALERGAHIVVGTPGRLRDHIQRGSLDMSALRAVVLDEADEMLDLGFREDLEFMLGEAPEDRRTLLFSATVPPMIATLAQKYQREAVRVTTLSDTRQHADIAYQALRVAQQDAENAIINVLRFHEAQNAIVFANTRAAVNRLAARFGNRGFAVVTLSGELSQAERSHALQAMRDGRARVCVATDVAARGIDLPNLELVVHAELPTNSEGLLHRSGRTGRAGRKGISALIVPPKMVKRAERLLKTARVTAEWIAAPGADEILRKDEERLLGDPVWDEEVTEEAAAFADRLLGLHDARAIAAAYLRLYRARHSAPEDLADPDTRAPRPERAPFGPSRWFALSVGRDDRAEPRWLLPLICRSAGLDKDAIGAIRVQQSETFVELTEVAATSFVAALGDDGTLEEGVSARPVDGPPAGGRAPAATPARKPAAAAPRTYAPKSDYSRPQEAPARSEPPQDAPEPMRPGGVKAYKPKGQFQGPAKSAAKSAPKGAPGKSASRSDGGFDRPVRAGGKGKSGPAKSGPAKDRSPAPAARRGGTKAVWGASKGPGKSGGKS